MKTLILSAAVLLAGTAFAQMPSSDPAPMPAEAPSAPSAPMPAPTDVPTPPATPAAPDMSTSSMPAPAPAPTMAPMAPNPPPAAQAEYPRCSKTVTDQCIQGPSGERDTKRRRRMR